jgi:hypothetical protein
MQLCHGEGTKWSTVWGPILQQHRGVDAKYTTVPPIKIATQVTKQGGNVHHP